MLDDAALLRAYAREGSESAFTELVRRHLPLVHGVALRQVGGDRQIAEEVAQKVFTDLARKAGAVARHPAVGAWLHRSARYAAIDVRRAEERRRRREEAAMREELSRGQGEPEAAEKLRPVLDAAIDALSPRERAVVVLRFFEERPFAEIGRRLEVSEDAARMRAERVLEKLRARLERRGITSTTAALSGVLATQAGAAVPAGLAASVASAALAGVGAAAPAGLAAVLMGMTKLQLTVAASLAANALLCGILAWRAPATIREAEQTGAAGQVLATALTGAGGDGAGEAGGVAGRLAATEGGGAGLALDAEAWRKLATGEPKALLARLRGAGVPEDLARKTTVAAIMARFVERYRAVYGLDEAMPDFWTSYTTSPGDAARLMATQAYWRDFVGAVDEALGPGAFFTDALPEADRNALREQYGDLAAERMVQLGLANFSFTRAQAEAMARAGQGAAAAEDQAVLAELRHEQEAAIAALLTPEERERRELRHSPTAAAVRQWLIALNPTEAEFRAAYAIRKEYEAERGPEPAATAATSVARAAWQQALNERLAAVLAPERAEELRRKGVDGPEAAQLARLVTRLELPFERVDRILAVQRATEQQARALAQDRSLAPAARVQRLEALAAQATAEVTAALGGDARRVEVYKLNGGAWLPAIAPARGGAASR